jgi:cytochrome c oxidase cbb3-type subunit I/II
MIGRVSAPLVLLVVGATACAGRLEERGRQLYAQHGCAVCHGADGRGDGPSAKRLDAPPRDFADARSYSQGSSRERIAAAIRNGTGAMPGFPDISESDASDIAAWIVSLQRQPGASGGQP